MSRRQAQSKGWLEVYRVLCGRIEHGDLARGAALPTIAALARDTGLTPYGARRVLERLRAEGRVQSRQGQGYRVADRRVVYRIGRRPLFTAAMAGLGLSTSSDMLDGGLYRLPEALTREMGPGHRGPVQHACLLRRVEGRPMVLAHTHFPTGRLDGVLGLLDTTRSVSAALAALGVVDFWRTRTRIEARLPRPHEAAALDIPASQAVLVTTGVNVDEAGEVVELSRSVWRSDCVSIRI